MKIKVQTPKNNLIKDFITLTDKIKEYFDKLCVKKEAYSEETAYQFNVDMPFYFALSEKLTNAYIGIYKDLELNKIYLRTKFGGWESIDVISLDDCIVILMELENISYSYDY